MSNFVECTLITTTTTATIIIIIIIIIIITIKLDVRRLVEELRNSSINLDNLQRIDAKKIKTIKSRVDRTSKIAWLRMVEGRV